MKNYKADKAVVHKVLEELRVLYPEAKCELNHMNPFELLVATILSAQTTDKKVNQVTKELFARCKSPYDFLSLSQSELEDIIKEIGLYRNKAKNILQMCKQLIEKHNGKVPSTMEELTALAGVGRKTANVVLSNAFGIPALAVDTHVFRVSNRIGLANSDNVEDTEMQLTGSIPREDWSEAHHLLIWHGRRTCDAKKPKCGICPINPVCKYFNQRENQQSL